MKKINLLLLVCVLMSSACKKNEIPSDARIFVKPPGLLSSTRPLPSDDPNLDVNWDWTQKNWDVYFNAANGTVGSVNTLNPFLDGSQKIYGNVDASKADMYPAGGWMLVARDFGTPTAANAYPFIVLYNKYRGALRVCILRTYDVLSSYQQITLSFAPNSSYPELFKFTLPGRKAANSESSQVAITSAGVQEWMIADFDVKGYSETTDNLSAFNINMSEIAESNVVLAGNIKLDGTAQPQVGSATPLSQILGVKNFYTSTAEGISKVTGTAKGDGETLIAGGVNVFFNSMLKLFTGFSGGGAGSAYNIKLSGPINLNGAIKLTSPKTSFSIYLKSFAEAPGYKTLQNISWGVFNIGSIPGEYNSSPIIEVVEQGGELVENVVGYTNTISFEPNFITNANFKINPSIAQDVASIEGLTMSESESGGKLTKNYSNFLPLSEFESKKTFLMSQNGERMYYGIKITFKNGVIVYELIPLTAGVD